MTLGLILTRLVLGGLLLTIGGVLVILSWGALGNLFPDYKDSTDATYLMVGLPFFLPGAALFIGGLYVIFKR